VEGDGRLLFEQVVRLDLEGIVCKRKDSPYKVTEKPSRCWIKVKNSRYSQLEGREELFERSRHVLGECRNRRLGRIKTHLVVQLPQHGLPPIQVYYGDHELFVGEIIEFAKRAKDAGVDVSLHSVPEGQHNFILGAGRVPEVDEAIQQMGQWLKSKLWPAARPPA